MPTEIIEDLLREYGELLKSFRESVKDEVEKGKAAEDGQEWDVVTKMLVAAYRRSHEAVRLFGDRALDRAGSQVSRLARAIVLATEKDLLSQIFLEMVLDDLIEAAQDGSPQADIARQVVAGIEERGWSDAPALDFQLLSNLARYGAAEEALELVQRYETNDPSLQDGRQITLGEIAYAKRDKVLALECLEPLAKTGKLPPDGLRILAHTCGMLGKQEVALAHYEAARDKSDKPVDRFLSVYGIGRCLCELKQWDKAIANLNAAVQTQESLVESGEWLGQEDFKAAVECREWLGYAETHAAWDPRKKNLGPVVDSQNGLDRALRSLIANLYDDDPYWEADYVRPMAYPMGTISGCTRAMIDIARNNAKEMDKLASKHNESVKRRLDLEGVVVRQDKELYSYKRGYDHRIEAILARCPRLPDGAAKALRKALRELHQPDCSPELMSSQVARAVEIVIKRGLLHRIFNYATRPGGPGYLAAYDSKNRPAVWVGKYNGRERDGNGLVFGQIITLLESGDVKGFIESEYDGDLERWLLDEVVADLEPVKLARNPAVHSGDVEEMRATEILGFVLKQGGLLQRLLEAGGLAGDSSGSGG